VVGVVEVAAALAMGGMVHRQQIPLKQERSEEAEEEDMAGLEGLGGLPTEPMGAKALSK
jgi:hypothetical protein